VPVWFDELHDVNFRDIGFGTADRAPASTRTCASTSPRT
jgi:hypothetical protein